MQVCQAKELAFRSDKQQRKDAAPTGLNQGRKFSAINISSLRDFSFANNINCGFLDKKIMRV